jgi:hypothetical protein
MIVPLWRVTRQAVSVQGDEQRVPPVSGILSIGAAKTLLFTMRGRLSHPREHTPPNALQARDFYSRGFANLVDFRLQQSSRRGLSLPHFLNPQSPSGRRLEALPWRPRTPNISIARHLHPARLPELVYIIGLVGPERLRAPRANILTTTASRDRPHCYDCLLLTIVRDDGKAWGCAR